MKPKSGVLVEKSIRFIYRQFAIRLLTIKDQ